MRSGDSLIGVFGCSNSSFQLFMRMEERISHTNVRKLAYFFVSEKNLEMRG
jgi:hypothetical protein